jgi:hypothetical protein
MPGFDGTGPAGMGPITGGGRGFCRPWSVGAGQARYGFVRRPGYGRPCYGAGPYPYRVRAYSIPPLTAEDELEALRVQSQQMARHLDDIQRRLAELEE